jgi:hypothetical protein
MTLFEYLAVAFSRVLSLATVRLLSGLSVAFLRERRDWPHATWIVFVLLTSAMVWWNFWSFRGTDWNFLSFLLILVVPSLLYLQAAALVPESPGNVLDWRAHFVAARTRFFVALGGFFFLISSVSWLLLDFPRRTRRGPPRGRRSRWPSPAPGPRTSASTSCFRSSS